MTDTRRRVIDASHEDKELRSLVAHESDINASRINRFLSLPDLTRKDGSPLKELVDRILTIDRFTTFDVVAAPEIVSTGIAFDLFNFPSDHVSRSPSDTYYVDKEHILRTHTTVMWYYHVNDPDVRRKIESREPIGALSFGKVYRRDEIDRHHMNVFHQVDGWYLSPKENEQIGVNELKEVLEEIVKSLFGSDVRYRFAEETFPFTDPSMEIEVEIEGEWVEVVGSGIVHPNVLEKLGIDSKIYNGWAFGFGLERLAILSMKLPDIRLLWSEDPRVTRQLKLGQVFEEVSPYPPITRDVSFVVDSTFVPNDYFDLVRDIGGDLVEEVQLLDKYEDSQKFGEGRVSYTYRIIYRSHERTLKAEEVDPLQDKLYQETQKQFNAQVR